MGRSRIRFLVHVLRALGRADLAVYDFAGTARAHLAWLRRRVPSLLMIHGIEVWEKAMPHHLKSCRQAPFLLANSAFTREKAHRLHGGFDRARVCWLATEEDEAPPTPTPQRPPRILVVGRMQKTRDKGHSALIAAMPGVLARVPEARLIIAGTGDACDQFKNQAMISGAAAAIDFRGFVPDSEIGRLWEESSVFAMPSFGEGFGLVYIEAMRHALPVVASPLDAAPEFVAHGETGFCVDPRNVPALADALVTLLQNPDRARAMGAAGQRVWTRDFRYSAFRDRFLGHLDDCLSPARPAGRPHS